VFYFAGGFAAMMTQTAMTLLFGTAQDARVPQLGASGAIAAVLGAYFVLCELRTVQRLGERRRRRVLRPRRRPYLRPADKTASYPRGTGRAPGALALPA
jgi:membrane associated rhomboid family serine protease